MDPKNGEVVRRRLRAFIEHAATESEPSDEGWRLYGDFADAVNEMADAYEASGSSHRAAPAELKRAQAQKQSDKLTVWQMVDIAGRVFTILFVIGLVAAAIVYIGINADEWEVGHRR